MLQCPHRSSSSVGCWKADIDKALGGRTTWHSVPNSAIRAERWIRAATDRLVAGQIPFGAACDVRTLAREAGITALPVQ